MSLSNGLDSHGSSWIIRTMTVQPVIDSPPLTVDQAAESLNLPPATLRFWIQTKQIAYVKLGKAVRIPRSEVERLLSDGLVAREKTA